MKAENAKIQADLLLKLINEISAIQHNLSNYCENECNGKTTDKANEYYAKEYRETYEALFNALNVVAQRYYELNKIVDK